MALEPLLRAARAAEERGLGQRLGLERRGGERGDADQARPGGRAGRRVEQVVARGAVLAPPEARVDAGGGDGAVLDVERVDRLLRQRVADLDLEGAADADVAAAVDRPAAVEAVRQQVGGQALARPAGVEPQAGRAADRLVGERDAAPQLLRVGPGGARGAGSAPARPRARAPARGGCGRSRSPPAARRASGRRGRSSAPRPAARQRSRRAAGRRPGPPRAGPRSGGRARCRAGSGSASRRSARGTRGTRPPRR